MQLTGVASISSRRGGSSVRLDRGEQCDGAPSAANNDVVAGTDPATRGIPVTHVNGHVGSSGTCSILVPERLASYC